MLVGKVGNNGQGQVLRKERKPSFEIQLPRGKDGGGEPNRAATVGWDKFDESTKL